MVQIHIPKNLPHTLGQYILKEQDAALQKNNSFKLAISGGSLVNVLQKCLINDPEIANKVQWAKWEVYFVDERIVPLDHSDSNFGAFKAAVLDNLTTDEHRPKVYPIDTKYVNKGKEAYEECAKSYSALLPKQLDLLLLGCGPDGHTCSLFPDSEHKYLIDEKVERVMHCYDSPKPPSDRITITLPVMEDAGRIAFVAEGDSKQPIMHEIFDLQNTQLPTALINKLFINKVDWFVNDAAFVKVENKSNLDITI